MGDSSLRAYGIMDFGFIGVLVLKIVLTYAHTGRMTIYIKFKFTGLIH